ncbi:MAG: hypothetical protein ABIW83_07400 [Allosphingosinicella sp.]
MQAKKKPSWADQAKHHEGMSVEHYWKPEQGDIEGTVIEHKQEPNRFRQGEFNDVVIVAEPGNRYPTQVRIRSGLEVLRDAAPGSRIFVGPHSPEPAPGGKGSMWSFTIYVKEPDAAQAPF